MQQTVASTANERDHRWESRKKGKGRKGTEKAMNHNVHAKTVTRNEVGQPIERQQEVQCYISQHHTVAHIASERDHRWRPRKKERIARALTIQ